MNSDNIVHTNGMSNLIYYTYLFPDAVNKMKVTFRKQNC